MRVTKESRLRESMVGLIREAMANQRSDLHISDLLHPMKAYFNRVSFRGPTEIESLYYLAGRAHEGLFLDATKLEHAPEASWNGLRFSPDCLIDSALYGMKLPGEFKTRRRAIRGDEDLAAYIDQLKMYCVCMGTSAGYLVIFNLTEKMDDFTTRPTIDVRLVEFEADELDEKASSMRIMAALLRDSIDNRRREDLPWCEAWQCASVARVLVKPATCDTCGAELKWNQIKKHLRENPKCKSVTAADYETKTTVKCPYFDICSPPVIAEETPDDAA